MSAEQSNKFLLKLEKYLVVLGLIAENLWENTYKSYKTQEGNLPKDKSYKMKYY